MVMLAPTLALSQVNLNSLSNKDVPFARAFDYLQARFANRFVRPWWRMQGFVERLLGLPRHRLLVRSLRTLDQFAKVGGAAAAAAAAAV